MPPAPASRYTSDDHPGAVAALEQPAEDADGEHRGELVGAAREDVVPPL